MKIENALVGALLACTLQITTLSAVAGPTPIVYPNLISTPDNVVAVNRGSGFVIHVDGKQYLITAKHIAPDFKTNDVLSVRPFDGEWRKIKAIPIMCSNTNVDIIAFALRDYVFQIPKPQEATPQGLVLGQDIYFYGFPLYYHSVAGFQEGERTVPFVGKGVSAAADNRNKDAICFYFHATNVEGFSGGPIMFYDTKTKTVKIAAVVSGFPLVNRKVKGLDAKGLATIDTNLVAESNPGIMIGYSISHVINAIKSNPIGTPVAYQ